MTESLRENYGIMVGIGCGRAIHTKEMPLDTAIYLNAAENIRKKERYHKGALILADVDVVREVADHREERLKKILEVLEIESTWDLVKQSSISREGRDNVILSEDIPEEDTSYFRREVQDAVILLEKHGVKVGWILDEAKNAGGEAHFDVEIAQNRRDIRFAYETNPNRRRSEKKPSLIGIPLLNDYGRRKPPYLSKKPEVNLRVCLPIDSQQLETEMEKIEKVSPSDAAKERLSEFCDLIQGEISSESPLATRLRTSLGFFLR